MNQSADQWDREDRDTSKSRHIEISLDYLLKQAQLEQQEIDELVSEIHKKSGIVQPDQGQPPLQPLLNERDLKEKKSQAVVHTDLLLEKINQWEKMYQSHQVKSEVSSDKPKPASG